MSKKLETILPNYYDFESLNWFDFNNPKYSRVYNSLTAQDLARSLLKRDLLVDPLEAEAVVASNCIGTVPDPSIFSVLELNEEPSSITKLPIQLAVIDFDVRPKLSELLPDERLSWVGPSQSSAVYPIFGSGVLFFSLAMPPGAIK